MRVAVTWQMCGYVDIDAPTVEEAMEEFLDNRDTILLPEDGKYIEGTFKLGIDDPELQKMFADISDQGEPVQTEAVECCPHCGGENVFLNRDVKKQGYIAKCQHCGEGIFLCDECLHAEDNTGRRCDWHEEAHGSETWGVCFRGTIRHQADTSAGDTPAAATQGTVAFHGDDMTRVYRQCGGTKFASGHKVSVECVVDGSGRLIRFLQSDVADVEEDCENGMIAGPFVCLSCFHEGKTLEEITVEKEHPSIGACLIKKSGDRGLDGADISRMMQELGEAEVYPLEFPAVGHESSAMGFITAEFAEDLEYDYQELAKYVAGILDDMDQETENGCYPFHGFTVMLSR